MGEIVDTKPDGKKKADKNKDLTGRSTTPTVRSARAGKEMEDKERAALFGGKNGKDPNTASGTAGAMSELFNGLGKVDVALQHERSRCITSSSDMVPSGYHLKTIIRPPPSSYPPIFLSSFLPT